MNRRVFLGTLAGSVLAAPLTVEAQPAGKTARLGNLLIGPQPSPDETGSGPHVDQDEGIGLGRGSKPRR